MAWSGRKSWYRTSGCIFHLSRFFLTCRVDRFLMLARFNHAWLHCNNLLRTMLKYAKWLYTSSH
jgi:hypothetical protein